MAKGTLYRDYLSYITEYLNDSKQYEQEVKRLKIDYKRGCTADVHQRDNELNKLKSSAQRAEQQYARAFLMLQDKDMQGIKVFLPERVHPKESNKELNNLLKQQTQLINTLEQLISRYQEEKKREQNYGNQRASNALEARRRLLEQQALEKLSAELPKQTVKHGCLTQTLVLAIGAIGLILPALFTLWNLAGGG